MLSDVTRGACPPVHLDKETGNNTQFNDTPRKHMHTLDSVTAQCIQSATGRNIRLRYRLSLVRARFTSFPLFTAWSWTISYLKHEALLNGSDDRKILQYCYIMVIWQRHNTGRSLMNGWMLRHITAVTQWRHSPWLSIFFKWIWISNRPIKCQW